MVLIAARTASSSTPLLFSRSPSLLSLASRLGPSRAAAAASLLHTHTHNTHHALHPPVATFRGSKFGPRLSRRLLTTAVPREKVKVLAVLYDGGVHAEQVRHSSSLSHTLSLHLPPSSSFGWMRGSCVTAARVWMLWTGLGSLSGASEKWGCHPREPARLGA